MAAILLLDRAGFVNQLALGLATTGFLALIVRSARLDARQILCCIVVATTGEVVLSLGWGLYDYQYALIPLYVPPGHGLFYALAAMTAQQELFQRHGARLTFAAVTFGSAVALFTLLVQRDVWGFLWWLGALVLIARSANRTMLSACFFYTILLEWAGTAIGNWVWVPEVPGLGLHSANPPAGVGILYILLDLIVVAISSALFTLPTERASAHARAADRFA